MQSKLRNIVMNKKGMIDPLSIGTFLVVVGSIIVASYFVVNQDEPLISYVGNSETQIVYEKDCINIVPEGDRVFFASLSAARTLNYTFSEVCR